ncbi:MAG: helix-turn-helix transcriptional regulator [Lachnospiraceae bacterium]|nr:helix-turn-helix transcriptional regulator [Lachnospiraceae bacterium]
MFEINKERFGAFVSLLRKEKGLTQKELAERLFISDKAVSKWETGTSIPDTALLMPLADLLGITVTELLLCKRMETTDTIDKSNMEDVVLTAISYSEEEQQRLYKKKNKWGYLFFLSLLISCIELFFTYQSNFFSICLFTVIPLGFCFGIYFCFFAKTKLPTYYDENRICAVSDGVFRMNVPGIAFNNSNWPHILNVGRIWSLAAMALYPALNYLLFYILPDTIWPFLELYIALPLILGGLFIPLYIIGKKYQ